MSKQENILSKQVRFLREHSVGLSLYTVQQPSELMTCCPPHEMIFGGLGILDFDHQTKYLPSSPDSLIKTLTIIFLEESFLDPTHLLRRIKQFAYDEKIILAVKPLHIIPQEYHKSYNEQGLRKMLVELFHLIQSSNKANKVADYLTKHPFALCILQTLFVHILKSTIKDMEVTFEQVISHLCQTLEVPYEKLKDGVYKIGSRGYIASHDGKIYKLCLLDQPSDSEDLNDSSFSIAQQPIDRRKTEEGPRNTTFVYSPIRQERNTESLSILTKNSIGLQKIDSSNHDMFQASTSTESATLPFEMSVNKQNQSAENISTQGSIPKPSTAFGFNFRPITHFKKYVNNINPVNNQQSTCIMKLRPNVSFMEHRVPAQTYYLDSSQKRDCLASANHSTSKAVHQSFENSTKKPIQVIKNWPRTTSQERIIFHSGSITPNAPYSSFWIDKGYGITTQPSTPVQHHPLNFPYFYQPAAQTKLISNPHRIQQIPVAQSRMYVSRAMSPNYQEMYSRNI